MRTSVKKRDLKADINEEQLSADANSPTEGLADSRIKKRAKHEDVPESEQLTARKHPARESRSSQATITQNDTDARETCAAKPSRYSTRKSAQTANVCMQLINQEMEYSFDYEEESQSVTSRQTRSQRYNGDVAEELDPPGVSTRRKNRKDNHMESTSSSTDIRGDAQISAVHDEASSFLIQRLIEAIGTESEIAKYANTNKLALCYCG